MEKLVGFMSEPSIEGVFALTESYYHCAVLFVDDSSLCSNFVSNDWVSQNLAVVMMDTDMTDVFNITDVPRIDFYADGVVISRLTGSVSLDFFIAERERVFGPNFQSRLRLVHDSR